MDQQRLQGKKNKWRTIFFKNTETAQLWRRHQDSHRIVTCKSYGTDIQISIGFSHVMRKDEGLQGLQQTRSHRMISSIFIFIHLYLFRFLIYFFIFFDHHMLRLFVYLLIRLKSFSHSP